MKGNSNGIKQWGLRQYISIISAIMIALNTILPAAPVFAEESVSSDTAVESSASESAPAESSADTSSEASDSSSDTASDSSDETANSDEGDSTDTDSQTASEDDGASVEENTENSDGNQSSATETVTSEDEDNSSEGSEEKDNSTDQSGQNGDEEKSDSETVVQGGGDSDFNSSTSGANMGNSDNDNLDSQPTEGTSASVSEGQDTQNENEVDSGLNGAENYNPAFDIEKIISDLKLNKEQRVAIVAKKLGIDWNKENGDYAKLAGIEKYVGSLEQNMAIRDYLINNAQEIYKEKHGWNEWDSLALTENEKVEEVKLNAEPITGEATYNGVTVNVSAPAESFPEGTRLVIKSLGDEEATTTLDIGMKELQLAEQVEEINYDTPMVSFDISFFAADDFEMVNELQPANGKTVEVTFDYAQNDDLKKADESSDQEIKVFHIDDKDEAGNIAEEVKIEEIEIVKNEKGSLAVDAESFSTYVLTIIKGEEEQNITLTLLLDEEGSQLVKDNNISDIKESTDVPGTYIAKIKQESDGSIKLPNAFRENFSFDGRYDNTVKIGAAGDKVIISNNKSLKANWGNCIAKIGNICYGTLQEAIQKAGDGATIILQQNVVGGALYTTAEGSSVYYEKNDVNLADGPFATGPKNITIDFNNHTYTIGEGAVGSKGTESQGAHFEKGSTITLKNGKLEATSPKVQFLIQNYSNLTLENMKLDTSNNSTITYVVSNNFGSLNVKGDTIIKPAEGKVAFDLWYGMNSIYDEGIAVNFSKDFNGTVEGKIEYGHAGRITSNDWQKKASLVIENGNFNTTFAEGSEGALNGANIKISGGTFSSHVNEAYCAEGYMPKDLGEGKYGVVDVVAKIGDTPYDSLISAISAAQNNDTINVVKDINMNLREYTIENKTITINLLGHTLNINRDKACPISANIGVFTINNGNVTFINGKIQDTNNYNPCRTYSLFRINNTSKLVLGENLEVYGQSTDPNCGPNCGNYAVIKSHENGTIEINGATVDAMKKMIIELHNNSNFIMLGSSKLKSTGGPALNVVDDNATITIEDGTINAGTIGNGNDSNVNKKIKIKGGTFNKKPNEKWIADGYVIKEEADSFKVVYDPVAEVYDGDSLKGGYSKLKDAVEAAQKMEGITDGIAVTVLLKKDVSYTNDDKVVVSNGEGIINKNIEIDLGGKTLTINNTECKNGYASLGNGESFIKVTSKEKSLDTGLIVTIDNGTIKDETPNNENCEYNNALFAEYGNMILGSNLTIEGAGRNNNDKHSSLIRTFGGTITVNGSTVKSTDNGLLFLSDGYSGNSATSEIIIKANSTIIPVEGNDPGVAFSIRENSTIKIEGGEFNVEKIGLRPEDKINIEGGTFNIDPTHFVDNDYHVVAKNGKYVVQKEEPENLADYVYIAKADDTIKKYTVEVDENDGGDRGEIKTKSEDIQANINNTIATNILGEVNLTYKNAANNAAVSTVEFSTPIKLRIPVKGDAQKVMILAKHGSSAFGTEGLTDSSATCPTDTTTAPTWTPVENGYATIYTCKASTFVTVNGLYYATLDSNGADVEGTKHVYYKYGNDKYYNFGSAEYADTDPINKIDVPYKKGVNFLGYYDGKCDSNNKVQVIDANGVFVNSKKISDTDSIKTYVACYDNGEQVIYTLTVDNDAGADSSKSGYYKYEDPITLNAPSISASESKKFMGWEFSNNTASLAIDLDCTENNTTCTFSMPDSNVVAIAKYGYTITWKNGDNELKSDVVAIGETPSYSGETPTKAADNDCNTDYTFKGWTPEIASITDEATYTAQFECIPLKTYTITWIVGETTTTEEVTEGQIPSYNGTPVKPSDAENDYTFVGWSDGNAQYAKDAVLPAATHDTIYTASFDSIKRKYTIKFANYDGSILSQSDIEYNALITAPTTNPSKPSTAQYEYTFKEWSPAITNETKVTGEATYTAQFTETTRKYAIKFVKEDGTTELKTVNVAYGSTPIYDGDTPTKANSGGKMYTFDGWTRGTNNSSIINPNNLPPVVGEEIYKAHFAESDIQYTVSFDTKGGDAVEAQTVNASNPTITLPAATRKGYSLAGWCTEDSTNCDVISTTDNQYTVDGNKTLYAKWTAGDTSYSIIHYKKNGNNNDKALESEGTATAGASIDDDFINNNIVKQTYPGYDFEKCESNDTEIKGDESTVIKCYYKKVDNKIVTFNSNGGSTVEQQSVEYNGKATKPENPTKDGYTFAGWMNGNVDYTFDELVIEDITLTANWTTNQYNITFVDEDGETVLKAATAYNYNTAAANIAKPTDPTKEADAQYTYTFAGWTPAIADVTADATYTATYTSTTNKYTITFYDEDGTTVLGTQTVDYGTNATYGGNAPSKTATEQYTYTFDDWYTATTHGTVDDLSNVTANRNVYARYTNTTNQHTVTFKDDDGETVFDTISVDYNNAVEALSVSKAGYKFLGWKLNDTDYDFNTPITSDITLTAQWEGQLVSYKVEHYKQDGNSFTLADTDSKKGIAGTDAESSAKTYEGFSAGSTPAENVKIAGDGSTVIEYYYNTADNHTVTFVNGETTIDAQPIANNAKATEPESPVKEGYKFAGWYNGDDEYNFDSLVTENITLTAKWDKLISGINVIAANTDDANREQRNLDKFTANYDSTTKTITITDNGLKNYDNNHGDKNWIALVLDLGVNVKSQTTNIDDENIAGYSIESVDRRDAHIYGGDTNSETDFIIWINEDKDGKKIRFINSEVEEDFVDIEFNFEWQKINFASASAINTAKATGNDNQGIKENSGKYEVTKSETSENTITITDKGLIPYVGGNKNEARRRVGILIDLGVKVRGDNNYNIEDVDYSDAARWGAKNDSTFIMWLTEEEGSKTYTFTNVNDSTDTIDITVEFKNTVTWKNEDGTVLATDTVDYGSHPSYNGPTPKKSDPAYVYELLGWYKEGDTDQNVVNFETETVTSNITYIAKYGDSASDDRTYTVTWKYRDADGTEKTETAEVDYNTTPTAPILLDSVESESTIYTFEGWLAGNETENAITEIPAIRGDTTYTASYAETPREYTITWNYKDAKGNDLSDTTKVAYNTAPTHDTPSTYKVNGWNQNFAGWMDDNTTYAKDASLPKVTGEATYTATYSQSTIDYTITYNPDNGSNKTIVKRRKNDTITPIADPTKDGYDFAGWNPALPELMPAEDLIVVAQWTPKTYTVAFNVNGGKALDPNTKEVTYKSEYGELPTPTKSKQTFAGWFTTAEGGEEVKADDVYELTDNQTLYAHWGPREYTIIFDKNGENVEGEMESQLFIYGTPQKLHKNTFTREGYTFKGWSLDADGTNKLYKDENTISTTTQVKKEVIFYAQWEPTTYTITYDLGEGTVGGTNPASYTIESDTITLINPTKDGFRFDGWTSDDITEPVNEAKIEKGSTGDKSFTANWSSTSWDAFVIHALPVKIGDQEIKEQSKENGGNGTYSSADGDYTVAIDETSKTITFSNITLKDPGAGMGGTASEGRPAGKIWFGVRFILPEAASTASTIQINDKEATKLDNEDISKGYVDAWLGIDADQVKAIVSDTEASNNKTWTFNVSWDGTKIETYTVIADLSNVTVEDNNGDPVIVVENDEIKKNTVIFNANYEGAPTIEDQIVAYKGKATAPEISREGYSVEWFAEGSETAYDFNSEVTENITLKAQWTPVNYTITYNLDGGSVATENPTNPTTYTIESATITLVNPTREGFRFDGWTSDNITEPSTKVTIVNGSTGNKSFTANWSSTTWDAFVIHALPVEVNGETIYEQSKANGGNGTYSSADGDYNVAIDETNKTITFSNITLKDPGAGMGGTASEGRPAGKIWFGVRFVNPEAASTASTIQINNKEVTHLDDEDISKGYVDAWLGIDADQVKTIISDDTKENEKEWTFNVSWNGTETETYKVIADLSDVTVEDEDKNPIIDVNPNDGIVIDKTENTVTFNANYEGATNPDKQTVKYGEKVIKPEIARDGYTFDGWFTEGSETAYDFETPVKDDLELKAKWTAKEFTITFKLANGESIDTTKLPAGVTSTTDPETGVTTISKKVTYDQPYGDLPTPAKSGSTFNTWKAGTNSVNKDSKVAITTDTDLTADWKSTGGSGGGGSSSGGSGGGGGGGGSSRNTTPTTPTTGDVQNNTQDNPENNNEADNSSENKPYTPTTADIEKYGQNVADTYTWARDNGITTIDDINKAKLYTPITRGELAKMMVQFSANVLGKKPVKSEDVIYQDVNSDNVFNDYIKLAYQYQIMGINTDGTPIKNFKPNKRITRGEFATVLSRVLYGSTYNKYGDDYYANHIQALKDAGILTNTNPSLEELRLYVMTMLERAQNAEGIDNPISDIINPESNNAAEDNTTNETSKVSNVYVPNAADIQKYGEELAKVYQWAEENGVIPSKDINKANLNLEISREDIAEIMVNYAINVLGRQPILTGNANYQDVSASDPNYIQLAYQYQIMGVDANGNPTKKFNPKKLVNRGEFGTIFSRVLFGDTYNLDGANYYENHLNALNKANIITNINPNLKERKRYILTILYNARSFK